ncbi:MAG: type II toxin-antitoxin system RelE/ParE family toxin [Candidatus Eremiobacteraeota bacterium]|nr:type II toxin-antitoxin system RelE/ParE family toxin [Candidatus Eremiobacteraeota bacterium]
MSENFKLKYFYEGEKFKICWFDAGQSCDFMPKYMGLEEADKKKVNALIKRTCDHGVGHNKQKWRELETGLFEMKSGQIRMPFFYHKELKGLIVVTHMFVKKRKRCPPEELERACIRKGLGNDLTP